MDGAGVGDLVVAGLEGAATDFEIAGNDIAVFGPGVAVGRIAGAGVHLDEERNNVFGGVDVEAFDADAWDVDGFPGSFFGGEFVDGCGRGIGPVAPDLYGFLGFEVGEEACAEFRARAQERGGEG